MMLIQCQWMYHLVDLVGKVMKYVMIAAMYLSWNLMVEIVAWIRLILEVVHSVFAIKTAPSIPKETS